MTKARARLRGELSLKLIPALRQAGFKGPESIRGSQVLHEFKRQIRNGEIHVLTVQMEKHQLPRFTLDLYVEPPEGIEHINPRGGGVVSGRLMAKRGPWLSGWFRADRPWWQRVLLRRSDTLEREAVELCVARIPEVERWLSHKAPSKHIISHQVIFSRQDRVGN